MPHNGNPITRRKLTIGVASASFVGLTSHKVPVIQRATNGHISADHFGVKADGNADDSLALQAFIDFCKKSQLTPILPNGVMQLGKATLTIHAGMSITGQGQLTEFRSENQSTAIILNTAAQKHPDIQLRNFIPSIIQNFSVRHASGRIGEPRMGRGIWMRNATRTHIKGVAVRGYKIGIDTRGASWSSSVSDSWIIGNETGFQMGATDSNFNIVGENGNINDTTYSGFNGGTITRCEIQANDVGVFAPYESSQRKARHIAHGMNIYGNIIEGNLKSGIILSGQQRGAHIYTNYFEKNATTSSFSPETSIPQWNMDWREVKAHIVFQEDQYGFGAVARIRDNHFSQQAEAWAIFQGRGKGNIYEGNEGYIKGIYAQQHRGSSSTLGLTARDNSFIENTLSNEIIKHSTLENLAGFADQKAVR